MTNADDMIREGRRLVDQHRFEEAIALFKQVIELEGTEGALTPYINTWEEQRLAYLDTLMSQYPEEWGPYREKVKILMMVPNRASPKTAISLCSTAIEKFRMPYEMIFRAMRFDAALKAHDETYLVDDFIQIWQFRIRGKESLYLIRAQQAHMQKLLSISDPKLSSVFSTLIDSGLFSEDIQRLFKHKIDQLALFESVFPSPTDET